MEFVYDVQVGIWLDVIKVDWLVESWQTITDSYVYRY